MGKLADKKKMIDPKYRGIEKEQIPIVQKNGLTIKVIAVKIDVVEGPVFDLVIDIEYFDVELPENKTFEHVSNRNNTVFA
jgi:redox-sensitive bicupin YhaK (pirin superfamily)